MKCWSTIWIALACAAATGCGDDAPSLELPANAGGSQPGNAQHGDARVAECDGAPTGMECGAPGQGYHCIFDACVRNACGDGVALKLDAEECDDGNERDGDGCSATCAKEVEPGCGNRLIEPGEDCDDGNTSDNDRCTAGCKLARCGDAIVSAGEECDDGNLGDDDACTRACRDPKSLCGNRQLDLKEECDDGNAVMDDACLNDCTLPPRCGDGSVDADEECDDGNTLSGDGCEADCMLPNTSGNAGSGGTGGTDAGTSGTGATGGAGGTGGTGGTGDEDGGTAGSDDEDGGVSGTGGGPSSGPNGIAHELPGCAECRADNCHDVDFSGIDAVADCFTAPAGSKSPQDAQLCIDVLDCAFTKKCGYGATAKLNGCWCTASADVCQRTSGIDANHGVCFEQILAATKSVAEGGTRDQQLDRAIIRLSQESYPSGAAFWLVSCDVDHCGSGVCTPP